MTLCPLDSILFPDEHPEILAATRSLQASTKSVKDHKRAKADYSDYKKSFEKAGIAWDAGNVFFDSSTYGFHNAFYNSLSDRQRCIIYFNDRKHPIEPDDPEQTLELLLGLSMA